MLDNEFYISREAKASLVSLICPKFKEHATEKDTLRSLEELRELMRTLNIETGEQYIQNKKTVDAGTILGTGKLEEIAAAAKAEGSSLLVFDCELTSSQIRNIKKLTGLSVVDRCHIILEIFSEHARTKEARIQIEIARLQYILPRLAGFWSHLGRQKGGIGVRGGEGEQQIELDRRIIRERIEFYKRELKEVEKSRIEQKKRRSKKAITTALVGYTNAGKSSLMNRLCRVDVLEEDKLFATLDSTFRMLNPDTKPPMILIDTVGFLSNLPNTLIDGFKTTLESALEADLLMIVCDISDPNYEKHLEVTNNVLKELGLEDKERIIIFNKKDKLNDKIAENIIKRKHPNSFVISSFDKADIDNLRQYVVDYFLEKQNNYDLFIPYDAGAAHSIVVSKTNVIKTTNHEKGIYYQVKVPDFIYNPLGLQKFELGPHDPLLKEI
ncbi:MULTISPECIES: GTPase HflX [Halobacteriovorax]|uniref:GTPase HflX n=1 Tax=Halobacteriovorax vibrionivorans TaxID=2152716 RepID=A0ABY0IH38_9BACT|nr:MULTISPECIES: GTPase HflX [Halobacteriovorax]RZF21957.1 GTPase HflX [Halobacteriovorax vibrionivorans]TGD47201.1 GTPase HflX [Halobacteriovorax sp. Y22]